MGNDENTHGKSNAGDVRRRKRWRIYLFLGVIVAVGIPFLINWRGVEKRWELDVHSGDVRITRRGFWGGITEEVKPAGSKSAPLRELFGEDASPKWLLTTTRHHELVPIPSRRGRRRDKKVRERGGMLIATMPLFSVLGAPHISDDKRRELIDMAVDAMPADEFGSTFHMVPSLKQAVLDATEFPDEERARWQAQIDNRTGPLDTFLKAAAALPARAVTR